MSFVDSDGKEITFTFILTHSVFAALPQQETDSPSTIAEEKPPLFIPHSLKLKYPDYEWGNPLRNVTHLMTLFR